MPENISKKDVLTLGGQSIIRVMTDGSITLLRCRDCLGISLVFSDEKESGLNRTMLHVSNLSSKVCISIIRNGETGKKEQEIDYVKEISLFLNDDYIDFLFDYGKKEKFYLDPTETDLGETTEYYILPMEEAEQEYLKICKNIIYSRNA